MMSGSLSVVALLRELQQVKDWHMLGIYLNIPPEELKAIRKQFLNAEGIERCKAELFELWLKLTPNASWDDVVSALKRTSEIRLAEEIESRQVSTPALVQSIAMVRSSSAKHGVCGEEEAKVKLEKGTVKKFTRLERKFASLVNNCRAAAENKGISPRDVHGFLQVRLAIDIAFPSNATISDLFQCIAPYYCFLNTTLLEDIIDRCELDESLQHQLDEYEDQLEEFTTSTEIGDLKNVISRKQTEGMPLVTLKLAGRCLGVTVKRFQDFVNFLFEAKSSALTNIQVRDGCICITWITRESAIPSLVALAKEKVSLMEAMDVLGLTVGKFIVMDRKSTDEKENEERLYKLVALDSVDQELQRAVHANPNLQDSHGRSLLGLASMNGSAKTVEFLIDVAAHVNLADDIGVTPLMLACLEYHRDPDRFFSIVRSLLKAGATVNAQDRMGRTALTVLCKQGFCKPTKLLIQYGADVQLGTLDQSAPLMIACENKHKELAILLLSSKADANLRDENGFTALARVCKHGGYDIANLLIQYGADVQLCIFDQLSTPLMIACENRHEDIATLLISSQAYVNLQDKDGFTSLMLACQQQLTATVHLLLSNKADPNLKTNAGQTALLLSCTTKQSINFDDSILSLLISAGADPNIQDEAQSTALIEAARNGYEAGVRILINVQADVNAQDRYGLTSLMLASQQHLTETVRLLLSKEADPNLQNNEGQTALMLSCTTKQSIYFDDSILTMLISAGADPNIQDKTRSTALIEAASNGYEAGVRILINAQADVNAQDKYGFTSLMLASQQHLTETVRILLSNKADPNLQNKKGQTALMLSCTTKESTNDSILTLHLLISAGANLNIQDKAGSTALIEAAFNDYETGVGILINAQAHVNAQDKLGCTALHYSASVGNLTITEKLLSAGIDSLVVNQAGSRALDVAYDLDHTEICRLLQNQPVPALSKDMSEVQNYISLQQQEQSNLLKEATFFS